MAYGEFVAWSYFDDLGQVFSRNAKYVIVKQTDGNDRPLVGGVPYTSLGGRGWPGGGLKPRTVTVVNLESGHRLEVVVYSLDAPLWVGTATTI